MFRFESTLTFDRDAKVRCFFDTYKPFRNGVSFRKVMKEKIILFYCRKLQNIN